MIHLSPEKLRGQFPGKNGPTKLVHMVMTVARDPTMQPVVICIDDCEQFFTGGKKNKDKEGPSRFKKDLLLYKNQALGPEHRVIIMGLSKQPESGDIKDMRSFFDKFLYFPYPDYASRCLVWKYYLEQQIREGLRRLDEGNQNVLMKDNKIPLTGAALEEDYIAKIRAAIQKVDVSSLAHISEGYSAGAIARTVRAIVSARRVAVLKQRPLGTNDFIDNLSLQEVTYQDDQKAFATFTATITGLVDRRKKVESIISGEADAKKGDKKGGKDKKGKK
jgi:SpoVK/Ycf46/Vps4 family AAA+-type ATPase